jgi:sugar-specific transcriptional regulator TrmB
MEREGLQREMYVARDFTTSIDRSREELQQQITRLSIDLEKMDRERVKVLNEKDKAVSKLKDEVRCQYYQVPVTRLNHEC